MKKIVNPSDHPALEIMEQLWEEGLRATEIAKYLDDEGLAPVNVKALAKYGQRKWNTKVTIKVENKDVDYVTSLVEEIEASGKRVGKISFNKRRTYGWEKIDGENVQVPREILGQTIEILPDQPEFEQATIPSVTIVSKGPERASKPRGFGLAIDLPDKQIGYHRGTHGELTTTHDEAAIDVAHQISLYCQETYGIDVVINHGDDLDFPMFSTHRTAPGYLQTTQLGIDRLGTEMATQRAIAPLADIIYLKGNHDQRLDNMVVEKMPGLVGLARSGEADPVLSVAYLCKFDEFGVTYIDGYPEGEYWLNEGTKAVHGSLYSSNKGGTAVKYLSSKVNVLFGHTHRREYLEANHKTKDGGYTFFAGSAGCLARLDGPVPSSSTGINSKGQQNSKAKTEDWQHGINVIWYELDGTKAYLEQISIDNGYAIYNGIEFRATVTPNGEPLN